MKLKIIFLSLLISSSPFLLVNLLRGGGVYPFVVYILGVLLTSLTVGGIARKLETSPRKLIKISLVLVPLTLMLIIGTIRIIYSVTSGEATQGLPEGNGVGIALLFLLLPSIIIGLLGSVFEFLIWRFQRHSDT